MALSKPLGDKHSRFDAEINEDTLQEKHRKLQKKNTVKGELSAQRTFGQYLIACRCNDVKFWDFEPEYLDRKLSTFWFAARQDKVDPATGDYKKYKVQSLKSLCYGLNRLIKEKGKMYDIITDPQFIKSQIAFSDACKELKEEGLGFIDPTKDILPTGN